MAIFGKKKSLEERMSELLSELDNLPEEEQKKFWDKFENEGKGEETTGEQIEKAKEDAESKGENPTQAEIDMSVGEQEKLDGNEDSQSAKDRIDEYEGEEKYLDKERKDGEKHDEAAEEDRLAKLESRLSELEKKIGEMVAKKDEGELPKAREVEEVTEDEEDEEEYEDFFKD